MAIVYRIELVALDTEAGTADVLFEAASPRADRLANYAPGEVEAALMDAAYENVPQRVVQGVADPAGPRPADEDGKDDEPEQNAAEAPVAESKPRKPRRTRAQIEADRQAAAAAAAAPAAAEPSPEPVPDDAPAGEVHTTSGVAMVTTFEGAAPVPAAEPEPVAAPPAAPAAPFNPFAPRT